MGFGKRVDKPGGLRRALREQLTIRAAMMTMTDTLAVDLLDLSKCGAKLKGSNLPSPGQEVLVLLGRLEAFGSIVWRDEDQCGVHFDVALSDRALEIVESERGPACLLGLSAEEALAAGDWLNGLAR
jgi:hypothetical protein